MTNALRQYLETALWSSCDDKCAPMNDTYDVDDFDDASVLTADKELTAFLADEVAARYDAEQVAHDFWLTRNRHGAGFWDGDYPEADGRYLTELAHAYGSSEVVEAGDGKVSLYG